MNVWKLLNERVNPIKGGIGDNKKISDFDPKQIKKGVKVEMEHTDSKMVALDIVIDHLTEDPRYYDKLKEAIGDEDDLSALVKNAKNKNKEQPSTLKSFSSSEFSTGEPDDDAASARKAAGLSEPPTGYKAGDTRPEDIAYTKDWMASQRYADQVITIDDRKDMSELIATFAAGMHHKRPLSPQMVGRYVGKLLLAHSEEQARMILMALSAEIRGIKR